MQHTRHLAALLHARSRKETKSSNLPVLLAGAALLGTLATSAHAIPDENDTDYTTVNWKGFVYQFDRQTDGYIHVARASAPRSAGTATVSFAAPPARDLNCKGLFDASPDILQSRNLGGYLNPTDYRIEPVAPIAFQSGPQARFSDSLTLMCVRNVVGLKGAKMSHSWNAMTFGETAAGTGLASFTVGIGSSSAAVSLPYQPVRDWSGDVTASAPEWAMPDTITQVGAAIMPDCSSVITAHPSRDLKGVRIGWWNFRDAQSGDGGAPAPENQPALYALPGQVTKDNWDGNIDVGITINPKATANAPYQLWLTFHTTSGDIWVGSAAIGKNRSTLNIFWKKPYTGLIVGKTKIFVDPAGRAEVLFTSGTNPQNYNLCGSNLSGSPDNFTVAVGGRNEQENAVGPSGKIPDATYSFGPAPQATNTDMYVDAFINFWHVAKAGVSQTASQKFGMAHRSAKVTVPANQNQKYAVVGFFEGPPPMPNENLTEVPETLFDTPMGHTLYGSKESSSSQTSFKVAAGPVFKVEGSAGLPVGKVDFSAEGSLMVGYGTDTTTESTIMESRSVLDKVIQYTGKPKQLRSEGIALLFQCGYAGHVYEMVDTNKVPFPGTTSILQMVPYNAQIVPHPFSIDPAGKTGIVPGNLMSYIVDQDSLDVLSKNSMMKPGPNGSSGIYTGWTSAGGTSEELSNLTESTTTYSVDAELQGMMGGEGGSKILGDYFEAQVGLKATFNFEQKTGSTSEETLGVEIDTPMPTEADYAFPYYGFSTFLEQRSPNNQDRLMQILQYDDPLGLNKNLRSQIMPGGCPWMVTYAMRSGDFYQVIPSGNETGGNALQTKTPAVNGLKSVAPTLPVPASLQRRGITTPHQVALLHASISNIIKLQSAKSPLKALKGVPVVIHQAASTLTPQERSDLQTYVKAQQAQSFQAFLKAYPNWKPRTFVKPTPVSPTPAPTVPPMKTTALAMLKQQMLQGSKRNATPQRTSNEVTTTPTIVPALSPQSLQILQSPTNLNVP